jgi:endogenous inhibitor of DNA gyrase (YacG/DUF329 family)
MEFYNNMKLKFNSNKEAEIAKKVMQDFMTTANFDFKYADEKKQSNLLKDSLSVKGNELVLVDCGAYTPEDIIVVAKELLKAIANCKSIENFNGEFDGAGTYSESLLDVEFNNDVLTIKSTYYPSGYEEMLCCPECGEEIVSIEEYDPLATYRCEECDEEIDLSEVYDEYAPVIENLSIKISK